MRCAQGAKLLADKRASIDGQIRALREVARLLAREQARLEERARRHAPR
jgi:hypothetical protein